MIVVSDTSAITSLIQIGREDLLQRLFARVVIPAGVRDELLAFHNAVPLFLEVRQVGEIEKVQELADEIDRGEAEAIILAEEMGPDYLLMDDLEGRRIAIAKGLPVIGLLGALVKAKRAGLIESLNAVISDLELRAGFRISAELRADVLAAAGE